ncbi:hypothetical protein AB0N76_39035, partial [Kitasatospora sp. NPDC093806]
PTPLPTPAPPAAPARGTRRRTALVATTALLLGAFGTAAFLLDDPDDGYPEAAPVAATSSSAPSTAPAKPTATATPTPAPSAPTPSAPAAAPGYTAVYTGVELVSPDHDYEFDLKTGKVMGEETATWFLARTATGFVLGEHNDAYVSDGNRLGTAECLSGLETKPVTRLEFAGLVGKAFCVRGQDPRDVAVVRVLSASPGDGPVKVSLDYYRKG